MSIYNRIKPLMEGESTGSDPYSTGRRVAKASKKNPKDSRIPRIRKKVASYFDRKISNPLSSRTRRGFTFDKGMKQGIKESSLGYKKMLRKKWSANPDIQNKAGQSKVIHRNAARFFSKATAPSNDAYSHLINQGSKDAKKLGQNAARLLVNKPDHVKSSGTYPKVARKKMKRQGAVVNPKKSIKEAKSPPTSLPAPGATYYVVRSGDYIRYIGTTKEKALAYLDKHSKGLSGKLEYKSPKNTDYCGEYVISYKVQTFKKNGEAAKRKEKRFSVFKWERVDNWEGKGITK